MYRNPFAGASFLTWFIARDLAHSVSVSRRFYWSLLNLWPDQLPDHTLVAMGARDELVPVPVSFGAWCSHTRLERGGVTCKITK